MTLRNYFSYAFLFALLIGPLWAMGADEPTLSVVPSADSTFALTWAPARYVLEGASRLGPGATWKPVTETATLVNGEFRVALQFREKAQFYRLRFHENLPVSNFERGEYQMVLRTEVSGSIVEDTFQVTVSNWGNVDATVTATLASNSPEVTVVDGSLNFGTVPPGAMIESSDTFSLRHDVNKPLDDSDLTWNLSAVGLPSTSFELIDKARVADAIDAETALLYKVYVEFNDERLPIQYRGRADRFPEARALIEAVSKFDSLKPVTQELIAPFRLRPDSPGSWYEQRVKKGSAKRISAKNATPASRWSFEDGAHIRVWWDDGVSPADHARVTQVVTEVERVWPKLAGALGVGDPPGVVSDAGVTNNGGDGRLDILLVDLARIGAETGDEDALAVNLDFPGPCRDRAPSYILVTAASDFATIIHEVTHALLNGYKLKTGCYYPEYLWLHEATATWAEHFIYPDGNRTYPGGNQGDSEHGQARHFLKAPHLELESTDSNHEYGAYLWFFFLTRGSGASFVRETWEAAADHDSLSAIDTAIASLGGLREQWPQFVLYNWNRKAKFNFNQPGQGEPYRYYANWDKMLHQAKEEVLTEVLLAGQPSITYSLAHKIPHLAARYFHYSFRKDQSVRSLTFTHPYWAGQESTAKVQAIVKIRDQDWKPAEDWTSLQKKTLCRDKPNEDFEELVIIISNSKFNDRTHILTDIDSSGGPTTELTVSALGCKPWVGSVQFTSTNVMSVLGSEIDVTETATATDVVFDLVGEGSYRATSGLVTWRNKGTVNLVGALQCDGEATGTFLVTAGESIMNVTTFSPPFGDGKTLHYSAIGDALEARIDTITYPCSPSGSFPPSAQQTFRRWLMTNAYVPGRNYDQITTDAEGNLVMKGEAKNENSTWRWEFKQKRN